MSDLETKIKNIVGKKLTSLALVSALSISGCNYLNPDVYRLKAIVKNKVDNQKSIIYHEAPGSKGHEVTNKEVKIDINRDTGIAYVLEKDECDVYDKEKIYSDLTESGKILERYTIHKYTFRKHMGEWTSYSSSDELNREDEIDILFKYGILK